MKTLLFALAVSVAALSVTTVQAKTFGLGLIIGEPTGLSAKYWLNERNALDAAVAWSFEGNDSFHLHANYLFHNYSLINQPATASVPVYYGIGARVKNRSNRSDKVGVRIPLGVSYIFNDHPFDLFAEIVPIVDVSPSSGFSLNAALGTRFYF